MDTDLIIWRRPEFRCWPPLKNKMMNADLIQYLAQFMPLAPIQCDGCTREVEISQAIEREGKFFHSEMCADIATAPLIKPQPRSTKVDGWDV